MAQAGAFDFAAHWQASARGHARPGTSGRAETGGSSGGWYLPARGPALSDLGRADSESGIREVDAFFPAKRARSNRREPWQHGRLVVACLRRRFLLLRTASYPANCTMDSFNADAHLQGRKALPAAEPAAM